MIISSLVRTPLVKKLSRQHWLFDLTCAYISYIDILNEAAAHQECGLINVYYISNCCLLLILDFSLFQLVPQID